MEICCLIKVRGQLAPYRDLVVSVHIVWLMHINRHILRARTVDAFEQLKHLKPYKLFRWLKALHSAALKRSINESEQRAGVLFPIISTNQRFSVHTSVHSYQFIYLFIYYAPPMGRGHYAV